MVRRVLLAVPVCGLVAACSHSLHTNPDGGRDSTGGNEFFGSGGQGGVVDPIGGGGSIARGGSGGCWWTKPSGAGGVQPGEDDGWPDSPKRAPGTATNRIRVDAWTVMSPAGAPSGPRMSASAIWTGKEMIVWGGYDGRPEATGGRYDPATDTWTPVSTSVAPRARSGHVAVWTGKEMIVWGGYDGGSILLSGGRYDPAADKWSPTSTDLAPANAGELRGIWTGSELIVWGSQEDVGVVSHGRYDPSTDTWRPVSAAGAPPLLIPSLVWTGSEMIIWGGYPAGSCASASGAIYNPSTDSWRPMTSTGAPHPRYGHSAVWMGTQMIVWGGSNLALPNAASYDPVADAWYAISEVDTPSLRANPALFFLPDAGVPDAGRMLLWGGGGASGYDAVTGAIYDFVPDRWQTVAPFPTIDAPPNSGSTQTTVWTGSEMLVWDVAFGVGGRYKP